MAQSEVVDGRAEPGHDDKRPGHAEMKAGTEYMP
jgi:hypothetical protein